MGTLFSITSYGDEYMPDHLKQTLKFYDSQAKSFAESTLAINLSRHYEVFSKYVPSGHVLDLGCGAGRDSKFFLDHGYTVTATDGSQEMITCTKKVTDGRCFAYQTALYDELTYSNQFDAVWAMASLVHVDDEEIFKVLCRIKDALKVGGIGYISVKEGTGSTVDATGRYFNFFTMPKIAALLAKLEGIAILEHFSTTSEGRFCSETVNWLTIVIKKAEKSSPLYTRIGASRIPQDFAEWFQGELIKYSLEDVERARLQKLNKRGGFNRRIFYAEGKKLVRDKIPELFPRGTYFRIAEMEAYIASLITKLGEEREEYLEEIAKGEAGKPIEELADICEVVTALMESQLR